MFIGSTITRAQAAGLLLGTAAAGATGTLARAQTNLTTLRIGILPTESAAIVWYASDLGYFAKAGIDAVIQTMPNSAAISAAVTAGSFDVGYTTIDTIGTIHEKHIPLVVIAPDVDYIYPQSAKTAGVVVQPSSSIRSAKDLNGKTVAIPALHSLGSTALSAWMDAHDGNSESIKYVELPFPAMAAALDAGRIDAAFLVEPFFSAAAPRERVLTDGYSAVSHHWLINVWIAQTDWAKAHPSLVRTFASVIHQTAVWANKNQAQSGSFLSKYTKMDPAVIAAMARNHYAEQLTPSLMQPGIDASAKYNGYQTFPAEALIYTPR